MQCRHSSGACSWSVIITGTSYIVQTCHFHPPATVDPKTGDVVRFDAAMQQHVKDGLVTEDPLWQDERIASRIVRSMSHATFVNAMVGESTRDWDVIVSSSLAIAPQSSLACRAGDIKRSTGYTGPGYLQWKHIQLVAPGSRSSPQFRIEVKLRFTKGFK